MQRDLLAISEARMAAAKAELADAEAHRATCAEAAQAADLRASEAYEGWASSIGSTLLGPDFVNAAADRLLVAEADLTGTSKHLSAAEREAEARCGEYQSAETRSRAQGDRHRRLKQRLESRVEERVLDEIRDLLLARRMSR
jgi:hypothetical protein